MPFSKIIHFRVLAVFCEAWSSTCAALAHFIVNRFIEIRVITAALQAVRAGLALEEAPVDEKSGPVSQR